MPLIVKLMYVFAIGAIGGWCLELVYRSIRAKRLFNPGFLTGPSLPIYGFGNVILYFVTKIDLSFCGAKWVQVTAMFLLIAIAMTLLELVTGYLFYHFMQLRLWDYTKRWGNYKGFICPLFTVFWGALGIYSEQNRKEHESVFLLFVSVKFFLDFLKVYGNGIGNFYKEILNLDTELERIENIHA